MQSVLGCMHVHAFSKAADSHASTLDVGTGLISKTHLVPYTMLSQGRGEKGSTQDCSNEEGLHRLEDH